MVSDLDGLLVVTLEQAVAAPYASNLLAEAGARVIKIERPEGDFARKYDHVVKGESAYFVWLNRGKESVCLDLDSPADRRLLTNMLREADVFIQNLKPGAVQKLGLAYEDLKRSNPELIMCSISGYGESGKFAELKAYDLLVQAESGLSSITGNESGPARVGVSICDIATGMAAYSSVLRAIVSRTRHGGGTHIEISLFGVMTDWMNVPLLHQKYGGSAPERMGIQHPSISPYGVYRAGDGGQVVLSIQNEREWLVFCRDVLERPEVAVDALYDSNVKRVENRRSLDALINERFRDFGLQDVCDRMMASSIAFGRLNELPAVLDHPQLREVSVDSPGGEITMVASGMTFAGKPVPSLPVPNLGQHTAGAREEFGGE